VLSKTVIKDFTNQEVFNNIICLPSDHNFDKEAAVVAEKRTRTLTVESP
jgi:hypothetical protein